MEIEPRNGKDRQTPDNEADQFVGTILFMLTLWLLENGWSLSDCLSLIEAIWLYWKLFRPSDRSSDE